MSSVVAESSSLGGCRWNAVPGCPRKAAFYIRRMRSLAFRRWCVLMVGFAFVPGLVAHEIRGLHASGAIGVIALGASAGQPSLDDCPADHHSSKAAAIIACARSCYAMVDLLPMRSAE